MKVAPDTHRGTVTNIIDTLYGPPAGFQSETITCKDLLVGLGMQVGEAAAELDLFIVPGDGAVGSLALTHDLLR